MVKPIPDGFHSVTPHLHVRGAAAAIDFYKKEDVPPEEMGQRAAEYFKRMS